MRMLFFFVLLALAGHGHAQSTSDQEQDDSYLTVPTFPEPNKDSFNWDAVPPDSVGATGGKSTAYPTQFVNGDFNVRTGWNVLQSYGFQYPSYVGLVDTGQTGGAAYLAEVCIRPDALTTVCPSYGSISQSVHVGENMRLSFHWQPGRTQTGSAPNYRYIDNNIQVTIVSPETGRVLMESFTPAATHTGQYGRYSEVDLSAYAGTNITVIFSVSSQRYFTQVGNPYTAAWSGFQAAVDSVKLIPGPANSFNGQAMPGNWFNPLRSGSGWDLRKAPNGTYYAIWYTYDEAGKPVWYISGQGAFGSGILDVPLYTCSRSTGNGACTVGGRVQLRLRSAREGMMKFDFHGQGTPGDWDGIENFVLLVGNDGRYSGHYYSNDTADQAWGLTALSFIDTAAGPQQNKTQVMAPIYYYDTNGQPTWSIATQVFANNTAMTVNRLTGGLCPSCTGIYPTVTKTPVGTLRLNFDVPDQSSMIAEMDLGNPTWVRPARRYYRLGN